jgi:cell wall-associated NlpC family hydrolase
VSKLDSKNADDFNDDDKVENHLENLLKSYGHVNDRHYDGARFSSSSVRGSPSAIKPKTDANQNFNGDRRNHGMAEIENRFAINQDESGGGKSASGPAGVINHHYQAADTEVTQSRPDEIDVRVRFGGPRRSSRGERLVFNCRRNRCESRCQHARQSHLS